MHGHPTSHPHPNIAAFQVIFSSGFVHPFLEVPPTILHRVRDILLEAVAAAAAANALASSSSTLLLGNVGVIDHGMGGKDIPIMAHLAKGQTLE